MKIFLLLAALFSSNSLASQTRYAEWIASDSFDEFTHNKSCSVRSQSDNAAGIHDLKILEIYYDGKVVTDNGSLLDRLGLYMETIYIQFAINSSADVQVLVDGKRYEFGSGKFLEAAKVGNIMTLRVVVGSSVYTRKFSLEGFSTAWNDVTERCSN